LVTLDGAQFRLAEKGNAEVVRSLALDVDPPLKLPINVLVGPIASGNVVVKDGLTWDKLKRLGVRSVLGLEMEAAAIGEIARASNVHEWIVVKGVMDHADPHKDDRFKPFAARASAEVLRSFLIDRLCALGTSSAPSGEAVGTLRPPVTRNWQPRSPHAPFLDELADAMVLHAPRFRGLYDLARAKAIEAYGVADQAYAVAEKVRLSLGSTIKSTHAGQLNRKPKILRVPTGERERELIAKIWNSHDEYIGEAAGDEADGLGISRVYAYLLTPPQRARPRIVWLISRTVRYQAPKRDWLSRC
jgi:hypothetical protein